MAGTSNNGDLSIVGNGVIEVYEVEDGGLQECMFVEKFSETSLSKLNVEKSTLKEKLTGAQNEIAILRDGMKESSAERENFEVNSKTEKGKLQSSLNSANQKLRQQESILAKAVKENALLKQRNEEISKSTSEVKKKLSGVNSECDKLRGEIKKARHALNLADKQLAEQQKIMFDEKRKNSKATDEMEDKLVKLQQSLQVERDTSCALEQEKIEEVKHVLDRLYKERVINENLSQEAEFTVEEMKKKLQIKDQYNSELERLKEKLIKETQCLNEELLELREKLEDEIKAKEGCCKDGEFQVNEIRELLQKKTKECEEMVKTCEKQKDDLRETEEAKKILEKKLQNAEKELNKTKVQMKKKLQLTESQFNDKVEKELEVLKEEAQKQIQTQKHCEALKMESQKQEMQKQFEFLKKEADNFSNQLEALKLEAGKQLEVQKVEARRKLDIYRSENKKLKDVIKKLDVGQVHTHVRVKALKSEERKNTQDETSVQPSAEASVTETSNGDVDRADCGEEGTIMKDTQATSVMFPEQDKSFFQLKADFLMLEKQLKQVKKHRNEVLRENNDLRHHINMATVQLSTRNSAFHQQIDFFRSQLEAGEHLYQEKLLECQILETQLQHVLKTGSEKLLRILGLRI